MASRRRAEGKVECARCARRGLNGFYFEPFERQWRCDDKQVARCERRAARRETKNK